MITILQVNKNYHYSVSATEKLSINMLNFFSQEVFIAGEMSAPTVVADTIKAQVEVGMGEVFSDQPTAFGVYTSMEELLIPMTQKMLGKNKKAKVLLALEDSRLYDAIRQALIKNKDVDEQDRAHREYEICSVLNFKAASVQKISEKEDMEILFLAVERLIINTLPYLDIVIIDLNKDINTTVKEAFEEVLDYSYKKSDISKLHIGASTINDVIKKAKLLNNEKQAEKMSISQKEVVSTAYAELIREFDRLCKGDLHDTQKKVIPTSVGVVFAAPNIQ